MSQKNGRNSEPKPASAAIVDLLPEPDRRLLGLARDIGRTAETGNVEQVRRLVHTAAAMDGLDTPLTRFGYHQAL